ncbi:MAG: hypothetical protein ACOYD3_11915, partial [Kiritimatiellia bacterium]
GRAVERRFYEYRGMRGGEHYERMEANPMIGYRGCFRNVAESDGPAHPNLRAQVRLGDCPVFHPFSDTLRLIPVCGRGVPARDGG